MKTGEGCFLDEESIRLARRIRAKGLDPVKVLLGALEIVEKGGGQAEAEAFARDYGRGEAKPIEAYL